MQSNSAYRFFGKSPETETPALVDDDEEEGTQGYGAQLDSSSSQQDFKAVEDDGNGACMSVSLDQENEKDAFPEIETPLPHTQFSALVGDTQLVDISKLMDPSSPGAQAGARVFAKCEFFNPSFSIKDRIVQKILAEAEARGQLKPGMTVVAASSGNTGASVAMHCAIRGYPCIITTSPKCSKEKMDAIRAYGAELRISPSGAKEGSSAHYMSMASVICSENPGKCFDVDQYTNQDNCEAYTESLGPELWKQTMGKITHFVASSSSGGTMSGTGRYLKTKSRGAINVVLADPVGSIFRKYFETSELGEPGSFLVEGVGKGSIPKIMDFRVIDSVIPVTDQQAFDMCVKMCETEGLFLGGSSGLNVFAAIQLAESMNKPGVVCTVLPDTGIKYLSKFYNKDWRIANGLKPYEPLYRSSSGSADCKLDASSSVSATSTLTGTPSCLLSSLPKYHTLVGNTPMISLSHLVKGRSVGDVTVLAKCEFFNPSFSIKDRIAQHILDTAEARGALTPGMTVVAASSGNTGAAIAMLSACRGYKCVITTSPKCSQEKMDAIRAYGAELVVGPPGAEEGTSDHYMEIARLLCEKNPELYFDVNQYDNLDNPEAHYKTLGPEIWEQTQGCVTHFVASGSTGGTLSGVSQYLKEQNPGVRAILADPVGSVLAEYFRTREIPKLDPTLVEGVGKNTIPGALNVEIIDEALDITDITAFSMCAQLCQSEGICAGGSSGLNVSAALKLAETAPRGSVIVTVLPDSGIKYLSKVYNPEWLQENGMQATTTSESSMTN